MLTFEAGKSALADLIEWNKTHGGEANEATTRLRLIDTLLKDVLGWAPEQTLCEVHEGGEFLDYVLGEEVRSIVVEAKRQGLHFELPAGPIDTALTVESFRKQAPTNAEAADQVIGYAQRSGIAIAVLCNGEQLVILLGSRSDGNPPLKGRIICFASLEMMLERFNDLWDLLSPPGIESGEVRRRLTTGDSASPPAPPLSARINGYPGFRVGTSQETDLSILGDLFIQDLAQEESITDEFLAECYCTSGALSQYAAVSREILRSRYAALSDAVLTESATTKHGVNAHLTQTLLSDALSRRPIVLLGDVGVGKSIFLKHLLRVDAKELMKDAILFYVDFLKHDGLRDSVPEFLRMAVASTLNAELGVDIESDAFVRAVYNHELNRFQSGIYGKLRVQDPSTYLVREIEHLQQLVSDPYEHIRRLLDFLRATRRKDFVLVLDNVDHHSHEFQERIFAAGDAFARSWPCTVFIALRPETFHKSKERGVLAAYPTRVFTISPPRADDVIVKRLTFALKQLENEGRLSTFPKNMTLSSENLRTYMLALVQAFKTDERLIELVDNLSSGNTRLALDLVSRFVGSRYVKVQRILDSAARGKTYVVPIHEFLRAILYGDNSYYDASACPIPNLFALGSRAPRDHFLTPVLLATVAASGASADAGFASRADVTANLQGLGYEPSSIARHLRWAIDERLVEAPEIGKYEAFLRVTSAGNYCWKKLITEFAYLDAVVVDTPILDAASRTKIRDVMDIRERVERCRSFVEYLAAAWPFADEPLAFPWPALRAKIETGLVLVEEGADRAQRVPPRG